MSNQDMAGRIMAHAFHDEMEKIATRRHVLATGLQALFKPKSEVGAAAREVARRAKAVTAPMWRPRKRYRQAQALAGDHEWMGAIKGFARPIARARIKPRSAPLFD